MIRKITQTERLFQSFYVGLSQEWNRKRYAKLANKLNWTEYELGAYFGINDKDVKHYLKYNKFPDTVCRHLETMDRFTDMQRGIKPEPSPWEGATNER